MTTPPVRTARPAWRSRGLGVACVAAVLGLLAFRQPYYPATWLDEGFVLGGAMSLVREGAYALRSTDGFRVLDQPLVANGPGVVVPIAVAWKLFGQGLIQARVLMILFALLAALAFFRVARQLSGARAAAVSLGLLLALPLVWTGEDAAGFMVFGRQALGNVPALCYFLAGFLVWRRGLATGTVGWVVAAGFLFGLATVTKSQYLVLVPALAVFGGIELASGRNPRALGETGLLLLGIAAVQAAWWAVQLQLIGWGGLAAHLGAIRASSQATVTAFRPARIPGNLSYLVRSGYVAVVLPSLCFAAWRCRRAETWRSGQGFVVVLGLVWAAWYTVVSVGWPRYAFEPFAIGLLLSGQAVVAALGHLRDTRVRLQAGISAATVWPVRAFLAAVVVTAAVASCQRAVMLFGDVDRSPQEFSAYLAERVPSEAIVESWEWELDVLVDLKYHHPQNIWVDRYTAHVQFRDPLPAHYDPLIHRPDYLVDGPFSKWTGIYGPVLAGGCCELLGRVGPYDLYRVESE